LLQNANDPPWTTTFPPALDADAYPPYMAPRFMHFRAQRSARMLAEDDSITFDELVDYKLSSRMELADRILDDLAAAVEAHGGDLAKRAREVLDEWDRAADAESRGAVLFARFVEELMRRGGSRVFAESWSADRPRTTPDGLADPAAAVRALEKAARAVVEDHGALDVPWGEVYRLRQGDRDLPANGGPGQLGIFRVVSYRRDDDGRFRATGGDSYVACIEFSDPVRARALLSYGNSSQPGSPHNGDQLEIFARKELRPVWRTRAEIEKHLEKREDLSRHIRR
jgi:acyl-homoserine-lactone acylase